MAVRTVRGNSANNEVPIKTDLTNTGRLTEAPAFVAPDFKLNQNKYGKVLDFFAYVCYNGGNRTNSGALV